MPDEGSCAIIRRVLLAGQARVPAPLQAVEPPVYPGMQRAWAVGKYEHPLVQGWPCECTQYGVQWVKRRCVLLPYGSSCAMSALMCLRRGGPLRSPPAELLRVQRDKFPDA